MRKLMLSSCQNTFQEGSFKHMQKKKISKHVQTPSKKAHVWVSRASIPLSGLVMHRMSLVLVKEQFFIFYFLSTIFSFYKISLADFRCKANFSNSIFMIF
jgi:hypothetical protein